MDRIACRLASEDDNTTLQPLSYLARCEHACIVSLYHGGPHVNQPLIEAASGEKLAKSRVLGHEYAHHAGEGTIIDLCRSTTDVLWRKVGI